MFSVVPPTELCALRSTQPLKVSTRDFSWDKGGQCVWLTTYHPCSAETSRKSGALTYPEPLGPPRPVAGDLYSIYYLPTHPPILPTYLSMHLLPIYPPTYLPTYLPIHPSIYPSICIYPWSTILPEKLTVPQLVKKFPAFYRNRMFITAFRIARHIS